MGVLDLGIPQRHSHAWGKCPRGSRKMYPMITWKFVSDTTLWRCSTALPGRNQLLRTELACISSVLISQLSLIGVIYLTNLRSNLFLMSAILRSQRESNPDWSSVWASTFVILKQKPSGFLRGPWRLSAESKCCEMMPNPYSEGSRWMVAGEPEMDPMLSFSGISLTPEQE